MKRKIIEIDENLCNGCGLCIPNCPEGAIQLIDGKARLIGDIFCDGLGACLGDCPEGAISQIEREAEAYDETKTMARIAGHGLNTIKAHLKHLLDHGETALYGLALAYLNENHMAIPSMKAIQAHDHVWGGGCPGSRPQVLAADHPEDTISDEPAHESIAAQKSELRNWPIQLKLLPVRAQFFQDADILLAADCVGPSFPNLHSSFMKGRTVIIGCPKLDDAQFYITKLAQILQLNTIRSIHVLMMEVPCCSGLENIARRALELSGKNGAIPVTQNIITIQGTINS